MKKMKLEQVKNEYKNFKLSEELLITIHKTYLNIAEVCAVAGGLEVVNQPTFLKVTLNLLKVMILQILELYHVEKKHRPKKI